MNFIKRLLLVFTYWSEEDIERCCAAYENKIKQIRTIALLKGITLKR